MTLPPVPICRLDTERSTIGNSFAGPGVHPNVRSDEAQALTAFDVPAFHDEGRIHGGFIFQSSHPGFGLSSGSRRHAQRLRGFSSAGMPFDCEWKLSFSLIHRRHFFLVLELSMLVVSTHAARGRGGFLARCDHHSVDQGISRYPTFSNSANPIPNPKHSDTSQARGVQSIPWAKCGVGRPHNGAEGADFNKNAHYPREGRLGLASPLKIRISVFTCTKIV